MYSMSCGWSFAILRKTIFRMSSSVVLAGTEKLMGMRTALISRPHARGSLWLRAYG